MKRILILIASLFVLALTATAQPRPGVDYLAGVKYEKVMIDNHPKGWTAGIFLNTFGGGYGTLDRMACSGKFSEIVAHIAPFDKSHTYPIDELKSQVMQGAKRIQRIAKKCPQTVLMPSPFCEHNHPTNKIKPILDQIKKVAPNTLPVNSIWRGGIVYGYTTEIHLENSRPRAPPSGDYIISFDGFGGDGSGDFTDTDLVKIFSRYPKARQIRLWNFRFNGKFGHKDSASIEQRKHWPDAKYIRGHVAMMDGREGSASWPNSALYKPFADDHGEGGKDNKAMVILQTSRKTARVFDSRGNLIDEMKRATTDHSGTPKGGRFYSSRFAYELGDLAKKNTGSRLIRIENLPLTDADLRSGLFK